MSGMKPIFLFAVMATLSCFSSPLHAQAPAWQWAKHAGGNGYDYANSVATDDSGNVYVTGVFQNDTIAFGTVVLAGTGGYDIFLAKYNAAGQVLWARSAGGPGDEWSVSAATDHLGNVFIAGYFYSPTLTFGQATLTNAGASDIFFAKYDANGNAVWARSIGGASSEAATCIATDAAGNVFVAGGYTSPSLSFGATTFTHSGITSDMFIAAYDTNGNELWAKDAGSEDNDIATAVAADAAGNVYVGGGFHGSSIAFGGSTLVNAVPDPGWGYADAFVAKYDVSGNLLWAKSAGGLYSDMAEAIAVDAMGNAYVAGDFESPTLAAGPMTLINTDTVNGTTDVYLAKYDADGNEIWVKSEGSLLNEYASSLLTDTIGNLYLSGTFESSELSVGTATLVNAGQYDAFIAKYDGGGNNQWAKRFGGMGNEAAHITIDATGNVYAAGGSESAALSFDGIQIANMVQGDIIVAKTGTSAAVVTGVDATAALSPFPNPATDKLTIITDAPCTLEIITLDGRVIETTHSRLMNTTIDVRNLCKGIYMLRINTGKAYTMKKFVKN